MLTQEAAGLEPDVMPAAAATPADPVEISPVVRRASLVKGVEAPDYPARVMGRSPAAAIPPYAYPSPTVQDSAVALDLHSSGVPVSPDRIVRDLSGEERLFHQPPPQPPQRYDSPEAIYQRYVAARNVWYAALPTGSIKTNQQYRRAMGLPLRYDKGGMSGVLTTNKCPKCCIMPTGAREWTNEEMIAY